MNATGTIVSPAELIELLESDETVVLLDARGRRASWETGHLDDAIFADANAHLSSASEPTADPVRGGRHPLPDVRQWCRTLGEWGITPSTSVVVYDDQSGANAAARAWWMLRAVGHEKVALLDGGLDAAVDAGLALTTRPPSISIAPPYPAQSWMLPTVDIDTVDRLRSDPEWRVIDVRRSTRFQGLEEPFDPIAGHIPGAVNLPYAENLQELRFKTPDDLRSLYEQFLTGVPADHVVVHCGSGVTACHTLLALEIAGMKGAALYVGSWSEWCRSTRPREPESGGSQ